MSVPSVAAQVLIALIPIIGIALGSVVAFFWLLWTHRERKLLISRGSWTPARIDVVMLSLLSGLLLTGVGAVLSLLIYLVDGLGYGLLGGLIPLATGASLLVFVRFSGSKRRE
jgi:hypothetical protein